MKNLINESGLDRVLRVIVGLVLLVLGWGGIVTGGWGLFFKIHWLFTLIDGFAWCLPGLYAFKYAYQ